MTSRHSAALAMTALALLACQGPPDTHTRPNFDWTPILTELDQSLLAACGNDSLRVVVGSTAAGDAFVIEQPTSQADTWSAPALPSGARRLWWCAVADSGEIVAVGEEQTILRRAPNGTWSSENVGDTDATRFYGVWNRGDDWFAVGGSPFLPDQGGVILRSNGGAWLPEPIPSDSATLFKVWGQGDALWAVGHSGTILREDDGQWEREVVPTDEPLIGIWGSSAESAYAVGGANRGVVMHYDGSDWQLFSEVSEPLAGVWTGTDEHLYVAGCYGFLSRYDQIADGVHDPLLYDITYADSSLCLHAMHGNSEQLLVVGADLFSGVVSGWRGTVLGRGALTAASIDLPPIADAGPQPDGAPSADAGADAAPGLGAGEYCVDTPNDCAEGLRCWGVLGPDGATGICAADCTDASECTDSLGADACCELPGVQSHTPVCLPGDYQACEGT